ncbi:PREDICTED: protein FAR1-RELATED SEQUENCE 5-like [Nelumbo nucifera]|uniref:Protein FAR1-RELATED SEQUENCE 5-like n=1 Tax=Nelumbo nucifera TaxID=4432 RepID=A0A1U8AEZ1_NELNU|nr:PREDICTED: protein FAR1-RELATED SEQUENCE 5-like [Nelumbo nucifera]
MKISRVKDGYRVIGFDEMHNHIVITLSKSHMLRSQRKINEAQGNQAIMADDAGIAPRAVMELMANEAGGCENIGFTSVGLMNYLRTYRTRNMEKGEAGGVLKYFEDRQSQDPSFVYAI